jgi:hypothetical protein
MILAGQRPVKQNRGEKLAAGGHAVAVGRQPWYHNEGQEI